MSLTLTLNPSPNPNPNPNPKPHRSPNTWSSPAVSSAGSARPPRPETSSRSSVRLKETIACSSSASWPAASLMRRSVMPPQSGKSESGEGPCSAPSRRAALGWLGLGFGLG